MAQFPVNLGGGGGGDLDQITATANKIIAPYVGVNPDGDAITGTVPDHSGENIDVVPSITSTPNGFFTMRVPEGGYYDSAGRLQVAASELGNAQASHVLNTVSFTSRYGIKVNGGISSKAAATYNVSSSNQTIAAAQYLSGAQTIRGVTTNNITAANVKYNVNVQVGDSASAGRLVNVTGSYTGDGTVTAASIRNGYIGYSKGVKYTGTLSINSVTSFSVAQTANNKVRVTCATPTAATGRPWGGLYVRAKSGSYPTSTTDGFEIGRIGTTGYLDYTSATNLANGATIYFAGWDYAYYNTNGGTSSYPSIWYGDKHNIGSVYMSNSGWATITASGNWTLPAGANRVHFYGVGGGGGGNGSHVQDSGYAVGGAGGGFVAESSDLTGTGGSTSYVISIGSGGAAGTTNNPEAGQGGTTTVTTSGGSTVLTALGGFNALTTLSPAYGGSGGSGGGRGVLDQTNGYAGGSNGANGGGAASGSGNITAANYGSRGYGQNVAWKTSIGVTQRNTTINGVVYAGGGGGGANTGTGGAGGVNGGGAGGTRTNAGTKGTAGTGGGAGGMYNGSVGKNGVAGGSGVVIAHYWKA